jgi:hypothetical protein
MLSEAKMEYELWPLEMLLHTDAEVAVLNFKVTFISPGMHRGLHTRRRLIGNQPN